MDIGDSNLDHFNGYWPLWVLSGHSFFFGASFGSQVQPCEDFWLKAQEE
jgi:hypothetical protein